jgi:hypothetical protein
LPIARSHIAYQSVTALCAGVSVDAGDVFIAGSIDIIVVGGMGSIALPPPEPPGDPAAQAPSAPMNT